MRYLLHNKLTKYMYVHVHYTTAKVNSFFLSSYWSLLQKQMQNYMFCVFFLLKNTGIHVVIYLCNYFKAEIDNWQGDL